MVKAPPRQVPSDLQPQHYCRLAIQYYLMGWTIQAVRSGRLALAGARAQEAKGHDRRLDGTPFSELSREDYDRFRGLIEGLDKSVSFGEQLLSFSRSITTAIQEGMDASSQFTDELIKDNKTLRLLKFGLEESFKQASKLTQEALTRTAEEMTRISQPPKEVPDNLSPQAYIELAQRYIALGWNEQARDSLLKVREMEGERLKGAMAWNLMRTRLPKEPVPYLAEEGLSDARRKLLMGKEEEAAEVLEELTMRYPQLELAQCSLAAIMIRQGKLEKAERLLARALEINPNYFNTWVELARLNAIGGAILESQRCLDKACELDGDEPAIAPLRQLISILSRFY